MNSDDEILIAEDRKTGSLTLNRPEALNALSLEMIRVLSGRLGMWLEDANIAHIIIEGAGERAFCAGGDVKNAYRIGMQYRKGLVGEDIPALFYGEEYRLNRQLFQYQKPIIAFMNGIVMGGGFGVAGPCRFRICSETTDFAMPEVGIGFFPDVGSLYYLQQCPGEVGAYLALSGVRINAADVLYAGLATHFVPLEKQNGLKKRLAESEASDPDEIEAIINEFSEKLPMNSELEHNQSLIDECFVWDNAESVVVNLKSKGVPWAEKVFRILSGRSPTSLKITMKHYQMGKGQSFEEIIARDFTIAQHVLKAHDFYEGVRAVLVDKDNAPVWDPSPLPAVSDEYIDKFFEETARSLDEIAA